jgi:hypothetical protein
VSDETKLRHALFAHIEQKSDEVWKSIDDLQKAMEAVPHADRSGPEWGEDGELSKRFIELASRRYWPSISIGVSGNRAIKCYEQ